MYPTTLENINLNRMISIKKKFKTEIGFSYLQVAGRSTGSFGAKYIEKHITLSHNMSGPDHWFSLDIKELKEYVAKIRELEKSLGTPRIIPAKGELKYLKGQDLFISHKIEIIKGTELKANMIDFKKPGTGIKPNKIEKYFGKE